MSEANLTKYKLWKIQLFQVFWV